MSTSLPTVGVVGLGLIGGGVALDLQRAGRAVVGFDSDPAVRDRARALGLDSVDRLEALVEACELVVVAVPLAAVGDAVAAIRARDPGVLVTDVASVKDRSVLGTAGLERVVGGHPMAGNERSGIDAARPGLFDGAVWFLTPEPATQVGDLVTVSELVRTLAAAPVVVDAATHDRYVALLSHLPHLFAYGLHATATEMMGDGLHALGGGSFRDVTRVAASAPGFWAEVLRANRTAVQEALALLSRWLEDSAGALDDPSQLQDRLEAGRRQPLHRSAEPPREVVLPPPAGTLGTAAEELHRLGAAGFGITAVVGSADGVTVRLSQL